MCILVWRFGATKSIISLLVYSYEYTASRVNFGHDPFDILKLLLLFGHFSMYYYTHSINFCRCCYLTLFFGRHLNMFSCPAFCQARLFPCR